jgi:hypothetical protein
MARWVVQVDNRSDINFGKNIDQYIETLRQQADALVEWRDKGFVFSHHDDLGFWFSTTDPELAAKYPNTARPEADVSGWFERSGLEGAA